MSTRKTISVAACMIALIWLPQPGTGRTRADQPAAVDKENAEVARLLQILQNERELLLIRKGAAVTLG